MKGRKLLAGALLCGLLATTTPAMARDNALNFEMMPVPITVHVDGEYVPMDVDPTIIDGRAMIPLRAAGEAIGCTVEWDNDTRTATAIDLTTERIVALVVGENSMFSCDLNDFLPYMDDPTSPEAIIFVLEHTQEIDVAPTIVNGRTLLPMRAFAEALDADVVWDNDLRDVKIDTPAANAPAPSIPAGTSADAAKFIKKYYVHADASDPIVGSWISEPQAVTGSPTYPGDLNIYGTDTHYTFFSEYNGMYQCIHLGVEDAEWYDGNGIVIEKWVGQQSVPMHYSTSSPFFNGVIYHRVPGNGYSSLCMFGFTQYVLNDTSSLLQTGKQGVTGGSVAPVHIPYSKF